MSLLKNHLLGRNLASQLLKMKLVSSEEALEFCSCNDEKEQFRQDRADVFFGFPPRKTFFL